MSAAWRNRMGLSYANCARRFFVDATLGNDVNSGRSPSAAWQTINRVNSANFVPGDQLLFKCGETWAGTTLTIPSAGTPGNMIVMGSYDSGAKPILNGGAAAAINVTALGRGYWHIIGLDLRCTGNVEDGARGIHHRAGAGWDGDVPGWIIEDCDLNCGVKIRGANNIVRNNSFDGAGNGQAQNMLNIEGVVSTGPLIEGNTVANCLGRGVWLAGTGDDPIVRNNTVHDVTVLGGVEGYGIDVDGYGRVISRALIEDNRVYDTDGAGIELENLDDGPICRNNIVSGAGEDGIEVIAYDAHGSVPDMRGVNVGGQVYNNLVYECRRGVAVFFTAGWDFFFNTIADGGPGPGLLIWYGLGGQAQVADLYWEDNIVYGHATAFISRYDIDILDTQDYNCYSGAFETDTPFSTRNFAQFQIDTGQEANSMAANPLFVNAAADDYHIQAGSPCRGNALDVGITDDLDGVTRGSPPDIGAYEYV